MSLDALAEFLINLNQISRWAVNKEQKVKCLSCKDNYFKFMRIITEDYCFECAQEKIYGDLTPAIKMIIREKLREGKNDYTNIYGRTEGQRHGLRKTSC